jgi:protein gp37
MAENTKIKWANDTLNLWLGCEKVSPACANCYAEAWAKRSGLVEWGRQANRRRTSAVTWKQVERFARLAEQEGRARRVFVNSLSDFFEHNDQVADWRAEAFELFKRYPRLHFLLLTKRANNIAPSLPADWGAGYPNVWVGTTVENQHHDWRIGFLREIPATVRFLSCEPLLSEVHAQLHGINWVICGGESGHNARTMLLPWARSLRDQCVAANVPFFFKQMSAVRPGAAPVLDGVQWSQFPEVTR